MKKLQLLYLDILSIPGLFMSKEKNAKYHLKYVCPKCPAWRRQIRYKDKKECWWFDKWNKKDYNIPGSFGLKKWLSQYIFLR